MNDEQLCDFYLRTYGPFCSQEPEEPEGFADME